MYDNGQGLVQDYKAAVQWYRKAVEQGNAEAQLTLGLMYVRGLGVSQDNIIAHMWWNISASQGNKGAKKNLHIVEKKMSPADITKAKDLAGECVDREYKGC